MNNKHEALVREAAQRVAAYLQETKQCGLSIEEAMELVRQLVIQDEVKPSPAPALPADFQRFMQFAASDTQYVGELRPLTPDTPLPDAPTMAALRAGEPGGAHYYFVTDNAMERSGIKEGEYAIVGISYASLKIGNMYVIQGENGHLVRRLAQAVDGKLAFVADDPSVAPIPWDRRKGHGQPNIVVAEVWKTQRGLRV